MGLHALLYIRFRLSKDIVSHWTVLVHLLTEIKSRPPETAMTRRLKGIMTVQRITQAESFALLFAHLMSICVLVITANYIAYGYCSWLSDVQTWLAVVVLMVAMVTYLLPSVLTEYRIAFWYHGMMAWCAVMPIFTIDYGSLLYTSAGLLIFRLALGLMFMDALRATLWNIVYLACTCYRFVQLAPLSDDKIDWRMYFMGEIALCVILSLLDFGAARASLRLAQ